MKIDKFESLQIIWNYLVLNQPIVDADAILVFGGHDKSVALHAADLFNRGLGRKIIVSGGVVRDGTLFELKEPAREAEALSNILIKNGVKSHDILLETEATNTRENFLKTSKIIDDNELGFSKFIVVQKPYAERRTYALGLTVWPDKLITMSSIRKTLSEYLEGEISKELIIQMMLGEIDRIIEYPKRGYMIYQEVPQTVLDAFQFLTSEGYSGRVIKE